MTELNSFTAELRGLETPQVHETRLDGVRTVWVDAAAPFTAQLMFRVGVIDEELATRGITHLVEHLALAPLRDVAHPYNGMVTLDHTAFWAAGSTGDVIAFLREVSLNLRHLPIDRLKVEARVLMAEAMGHPGTAGSSILAHRFGARGPGLIGFEEYGLRRVSGAEVNDWAIRHFTADNAVLLLTGPPPDGLELPLRRGAHSPLPTTWAYDDLPEEPTNVREQEAGGSLAVFGARTTALRLATDVVRQRLEDRLRHDLGRVYAVGGEYVPLTPTEAFVVWGADSEPAHAVEVSETLVESVRDIAQRGPSDEELARAITKIVNQALVARDSLAQSQGLESAQAMLFGRDPLDLVEHLGSLADIAAGDIAAALRRPFERAVGVLAAGAETGFAPYSPDHDNPISGRAFRAKRGKARMVLGSDAMALQVAGEQAVLRFDQLAVSDHVQSTRRILIDERGAWIDFDATQWWRGERLLAGLDAATPPDVVIPTMR